uniref:Uncharacterized protein n=1 Tax=Anguilla anguilla TaxID=7936 RepID=A0A0E9TZR8_ANGAN
MSCSPSLEHTYRSQMVKVCHFQSVKVVKKEITDKGCAFSKYM